jgi:hypothetical protein
VTGRQGERREGEAVFYAFGQQKTGNEKQSVIAYGTAKPISTKNLMFLSFTKGLHENWPS